MQHATPETATIKHRNAITPRNNVRNNVSNHMGNSANGTSDYKVPTEETRLALGNILSTPSQPSMPDIESKHSDTRAATPKTGSRLTSFTIYSASILWIAAMVMMGLSPEMQAMSLIETIQLSALAFMPLLLLSMLLINLRNNERNAQILRDHQAFSASSPVMPAHHGDNATNSAFSDTINQHNAMMQQSEGNLKNMILMVDERIKAMRTLSTTAEAEFQNITEHMGKALRDNLGRISQSTQESMGELKNVVNVIQDREENLTKLTQHFTTIEKDIGEILEKRQRDIRQQIEQQIGGILSSFR